jgi:hypothetical protein
VWAWVEYYFKLFNLLKSPEAVRAAFKKISACGDNAEEIWKKFNSFPPKGDFVLNSLEEIEEMIRKAVDHIKWIGIPVPDPPLSL